MQVIWDRAGQKMRELRGHTTAVTCVNWEWMKFVTPKPDGSAHTEVKEILATYTPASFVAAFALAQ